ncbi:winged helix-turn-helix transcriptional regulator [Infirmifilum sp. SLHALR2]|nr:MAG: hypothetical protein B7L53_05680 [Thermofilum sp. NZ13]
MRRGNLEQEVEEKVRHVLNGVSETLEKFVEEGKLSLVEVKMIISSLEPSFRILSKKWALTLLYALLLAGPSSFNQLRTVTGISKRSLALRLKELEVHGLIAREVKPGPPTTILYRLTEAGRDTALLMVPLIYYLSRQTHPNLQS